MRISAWWFDSQRAIFLFFRCAVFFTFFLFGVVWFHNRVPLLIGLDTPGILQDSLRCGFSYRFGAVRCA